MVGRRKGEVVGLVKKHRQERQADIKYMFYFDAIYKPNSVQNPQHARG